MSTMSLRRRSRVALFYVTAALLSVVHVIKGELKIEIKRNPTIIYHNAPPGVPVVHVSAYDDVTDEPLDKVDLTSGDDAKYFELVQEKNQAKEYALKVKKKIDKPVGYTFKFNVYARHRGQFPDRRLEINVTKINEFAPMFGEQEYEFLALRQGVNFNLTDIGKVSATDPDEEAYNRVFQYHILDPAAVQYFYVDPTHGQVELIDELPDDVTNMTFTVTAIDAGSPSKLNTSHVTVKITDVRPPDIFCVASDTDATRICWKDPTNGSYVMKYELLLQVDDQNATKRQVDVRGIDDETCSVIDGAQMGKNFTFAVRVLEGLEWSPESIQRQVRIEENGNYGDCKEFSECSKHEPCDNNATCHVTDDDVGYMCNCTHGWAGVNCTEADYCATGQATCQNGGTCLFTGDKTSTCLCPDSFFGNNCSFFNVCYSHPCKNNGKCFNIDNSTFMCRCPEHFTGTFCETRVPCSPSPCQRGECTELGDSFKCTCPIGYFGVICEKHDTCMLQTPCGAHGQCHLTGGTSDSDYGDNYVCTCDRGFRGDMCQYLDICEYSEVTNTPLCQHNSTCHYKPTSSYVCECTGGYWGGECQRRDPCFEKPCQSGTCKNLTDVDYTCKCFDGYFNKHCEEFDPCSLKPCHSESLACRNVSNSEFICECPTHRHGSTCQFLDGCHSSPCENNSTCRNISTDGDVECECKLGYLGQFCEIIDLCFPDPCKNGGTCLSSNSTNHYQCACAPGFLGNTCSIHDSCLSKPCQNNGICILYNETGTFHCACANGYIGSYCQAENPCLVNPCWNNGTCVLSEDDVISYRCACQDFIYGTHCENVDFCSIDNTCQNGGTCIVTEGLMAYDINLKFDPNSSKLVRVANRQACNCTSDFIGTNCEKESPCNSDPCGPGKCLLQGEDYTCKCPDGTTRLSCDVGFCPEDSNFYDKTGRYVWPRTISGDTARVACRHGRKYPIGVGDAIRLCSPSSGGDQYWEAPDTSACLELEEGVVSANLKNLASLTSDASGLRSDEIANITTVLEEYFFFSVENQEIATEMTMVVGNLMDANESVIIESNSKNHSSDRLLWLLDEYVSKVNASSEVSIETENINLKVVNHSTPELGFSYSPELPVSADDDDDDDKTSKQGGVTLNLPPEAMVSMDTPDKEVNPRIQLKTFRSSAFFIPEAEVPPHDVVLKQWVVTAEVNGRSVRNLSTPVEINIQNIENGASHTCVYWDVNNRSWSTEGVVTDAKNIGHTRCLSYHLTSFAILLDPSPDHQISTKHDQILTFISYIGCGISMLGLVLTLITYSLFRPKKASVNRCLNREKSGKILMNLCASMLIMNIVFVVGSETSLSASGDVACKVVAILLHYFLLSTLTWMLVEAINMYQALITVFAKYSGYFMLKRCIFAWGFPALVVITTVSISVDNYLTTTELCFLSQGNQVAFFAALLGPACLILLINTAVFIMVSRVILKPRFRGHAANKDDGDTINPAQIRGAFTVMTLLGITWVFGPFAINEAKLVINYVFTVLNSLQGFLIFVFRCLFNPEVRASWLLLVKSGQFKRRRGPVTYTSDTTSSKSDNRSHGSFADTMKTNMYNNSLGKPRNVLNNDHNIDTKNTNLHTKSTKELHPYFDDIQKQKASAPRRPFGSEEYTGRLNGTTGSNHLHSNGLDRNGKDGRYGDENGVTTIYTGKQNGIRRVSGNTTGNDELTRL